MRFTSQAVAAATIAATTFVLLPQTASAGNDDAVLIGDDAAMLGGAVTAIVEGGAGLWYNPAGIARTNLSTLDLTATAYALNLYRVSSMASFSGGESTDASVDEIVVIPTSLSYVRPLDDDLRLGAALFVTQRADYVLRTNLSADRPGGQRIDLILDEGVQATRYHAMAGLATSIGEQLHLGFAIQAAYLSEVNNTQAAAALVNADTSESDNFVAQTFQASYTGIALAASLGVQWQPSDRWAFGLTVVSPFALVYSSLRAPSINVISGIGGVSEAAIADTQESSFSFDPAFPAKFRLGAAYLGNGWGASIDGDYAHPLKNDELGIDRTGVWNLRAGAYFDVGDELRMGFGAFTDRSAFRAPEQFGEFRAHFYGATVGMSFQSERNLNEELEGIEQLLLGTNIAVRYAYGTGDYVGFVLDDGFTARQDLFTPRVVNTYGHEIGVYIGSRVRF
ncbi:MAG: hypothetical protein AAGF12_30350 [Myxococcota bacterium]